MITKRNCHLLMLSFFLLLTYKADSQELKKDDTGIGVRLQPIYVDVEFSFLGFYNGLIGNLGQKNLLLREEETIYETHVDWVIPYLRKKSKSEGSQRLMAAPMHLLGWGMGKEEAIRQSRVRREYPDFIRN